MCFCWSCIMYTDCSCHHLTVSAYPVYWHILRQWECTLRFAYSMKLTNWLFSVSQLSSCLPGKSQCHEKSFIVVEKLSHLQFSLISSKRDCIYTVHCSGSVLHSLLNKIIQFHMLAWNQTWWVASFIYHTKWLKNEKQNPMGTEDLVQVDSFWGMKAV